MVKASALGLQRCQAPQACAEMKPLRAWLHALAIGGRGVDAIIQA
jgi:hypothetical protein